MNQRQYKSAIFVAHFLLWSLGAIFSFYRGAVFVPSKVLPLIHLFLSMSLFYLSLFILIPRFLDKNRFSLFTLTLIVASLTTFSLRLGINWIYVNVFEPDYSHLLSASVSRIILINTLFTLLLPIPFKMADIWYNKKLIKDELNKRKLEAELRFLKAQINPHFLFNVLNNAYSLTLMESEKAGPTIKKLTEMMDFMLNECKAPLIPLEKEISYLHNYLELQQLKKDGEMEIDFVVEGESKGKKIPPLLLIPLYENAFKHGNPDHIGVGWLKSSIQILDNNLNIQISNSIGVNQKEYKDGGVGLDNIKKRLELIYPEKHSFGLSKTENQFNVHLQIEDVDV